MFVLLGATVARCEDDEVFVLVGRRNGERVEPSSNCVGRDEGGMDELMVRSKLDEF